MRVRRVALHCAVLFGLVATAAAYAATEKTVTVSVDGRAMQVTTHGGFVRDALAAAGLGVGPHDLLAPPAGSAIRDGDRVAVRRGRLLSLVLDGHRRQVWVTASSVQEALDQIGLRTDGALLSASRSRPIPLSGLSLDVVTPKSVAILADGHVTMLQTVGPTVRDALLQAGVALRPADGLTPARQVPVTDHLVIRVTRVVGRTVTESVPIPYDTVRRPDPNRYVGDSGVLVAGRPGVLVRTFTLTFADGRLVGRQQTSEQRTAEPVTEVVAVGTAPQPAPPPAPASGSGSGSGSGLNWGALAQCESGGNPRSVSSNGDYRGLYQFSVSTWQGVGGAGDPIDASPSEQTYRAQLLYNRDGRSPWPVCGRYL